MTDELLRRSISVDLSAVDERTLEGLCIPYGKPAKVQDHPEQAPYMEVFHPGAFTRALKAPNRVQLRFAHAEGLMDRLGRALRFEEYDDGLHGAFKVVSGPLGDHALALVDSGMISGLSIGFRPMGRRKVDDEGAVIRDRCHLEEVSLVDEPAWKEAVVTARREAPLPSRSCRCGAARAATVGRYRALAAPAHREASRSRLARARTSATR